MISGFAQNVSLMPLTTLKAGGVAEHLAFVRSSDELAAYAIEVQSMSRSLITLGSGSNILPSDAGVPGYTIVNLCTELEMSDEGRVIADCGCGFQDVFLKTTQTGFTGLEFAVGIPGTLGGALVSNAGAYRSNISTHLIRLEIVFEGARKWVEPSFMQFAYRDSILRRSNPPSCVLLRAEFLLPKGNKKHSYEMAREYQRQRTSKQPAPASAGSFFKNVENKEFARSLARLPENLKEAGVVPSGFLIEESGLRGFKLGRARVASKHANFLLNTGGATANNIRNLADYVKNVVRNKFSVELEEEVLYLGDWSGYHNP